MALKAKGMDDTAYGLRRDRKEKAQERRGGPAKGTTRRAPVWRVGLACDNFMELLNGYLFSLSRWRGNPCLRPLPKACYTSSYRRKNVVLQNIIEMAQGLYLS